MIVATAGHVDHGKTSLVKHLTGVDTDRLEEEKRRGLSINLGYAYRPLPGGAVIGFIDVPGHSRFINTMIAGVSGIDICMLVVAADDGVMPQTLEHLDVLRLLGVDHYLLVVTKIDRVDPARVFEVREAALGLLPDATQAFQVSNTSAEGIAALQSALDELGADWEERAARGHFRMSIDRAFNLKGAGLVVTGTVIAGVVSGAQQLLLQPRGKIVRVRKLHAQDRAAESAGPGMRCALNISGDVEKADIERGEWITAPEAIGPVGRFDARVELLSQGSFALRQLTPVKVHLGARRLGGKLFLIEDPGSRFKPGENRLVQLILDAPVVCCHGDRFLLRDDSESLTLGGGVVLDPFAPRSGKSKAARLARLAALEAYTAIEALRGIVLEHEQSLDLGEFRQAWNLRKEELNDILDMGSFGPARRIVSTEQDLLVSDTLWSRGVEALRECLQDWHRAHPSERGVAPAQLKRQTAQLRSGVGAAFFEDALFVPLLTELLKSGKARLDGGLLRDAEHRASYSAAEQKAWDGLQAVMKASGVRIPSLSQLLEATAVDRKLALAVLGRSIGEGRAHKLSESRYALSETLLEFARVASSLAEQDGQFTVIQFRDAAGCGRNLAIEVLEYFDSVGYTYRRDDIRFVRSDRVPEELFSG